MINVLISGVGGDVAQGVIKCLEKSKLKTKIYKIANSIEESWLYINENSYLSPLTDSEEYISYLCEFIIKHKIDVFTFLTYSKQEADLVLKTYMKFTISIN